MNLERVLALVLGVSLLSHAGCQDDKKPRIGGFCTDGSDCPASSVCLDGTCMATCAGDAPCEANYACVDDICLPICQTRVTCPTSERGQWGCLDGTCRPMDAPGVVEAGTDRAIDEGEVVTLDATTDSQPLVPIDSSFRWDLMESDPPGVVITLESLDKADAVLAGRVRFTAPSVVQDTVLTFAVDLLDGAGRSVTDQIHITVKNSINELPAVQLQSPADTYEAGDTVTLSAEGTVDPNPGTALTYTWSFSGLGADAVEWEDASEAKDNSVIRFVAPTLEEDWELTVTVTVDDGTDIVTESIILTIHGSPTPPDCIDDADCEDGDACTADSCSEGECTSAPAPDGTPCQDDGDPCTLNTCTAGSCVPSPSPNDIACDDGDACTENDACTDGACGGLPVSCDSEDPCKQGSCDSAEGCLYTPKPLATPCNGALGLCSAFGECTSAWIELFATSLSGVEFEPYDCALSALTSNGEGGMWAAGRSDWPEGGEGSSYSGMFFDISAASTMPIPSAVVINGPLYRVGRDVAITDYGEIVIRDPEEGWDIDYNLTYEALGEYGSAVDAVTLDYGPPDSPEKKFVFAMSNTWSPFLACPYTTDWPFTCYSVGPAELGVQFDRLWIDTVLGTEPEGNDPWYLPGAGFALGYPAIDEVGLGGVTFGTSSGIWANPDDAFSGSWSSDPPAGCIPGTAPCAEVLSWRDLQAQAPNDVWALGWPGQLLHFDGGGWTSWPLPPIDGVSPDAIEPAALTVGEGATWVVAEMVGCGLACGGDGPCSLGCPGDFTSETHVLYVFDHATQSWGPPRELGHFACATLLPDDTSACSDGIGWLASVADVAFLPDGTLAVVGAGPVAKFGEGNWLARRNLVYRFPLHQAPTD